MEYSVKSGLVCGLDEAGRGAFAGPLVCAAVTLSNSFKLSDFPKGFVFRDSKKMSSKQREKAYGKIFDFANKVNVVAIPASAINSKGVGWANWHGFNKLLAASKADSNILDGVSFTRRMLYKSQFVVKADATVPAAICAGIIAKVTRDRLMNRLAKIYNLYDWQNNKGYGTSSHRKAIVNFGVTKHHRLQFVKSTLTSYHYK